MSSTSVLLSAAVVLAAVHAQPQGQCPTSHILAALPGMQAACDCNAAIERREPRGTRVYSYDQYVVLDGHRNVHFSIHAKLSCAENALVVYDPQTAQRALFSLNAKIIRWKDAKEVFVRPGNAMPAQLKRDVSSGIAHFKTTVEAE